MKRGLSILVALLVAITVSAADKLPKKAVKASASVASLLTYSDGVLKKSGTAVFVGGGGDALVPYSLISGADSAVIVDANGKPRSVIGIVGLNNVYDCVRVRVAADKKISHLPVARDSVPVGSMLYMLPYGSKNGGNATAVKVAGVDSLYSNAYYTLDIKMQESYEALPLVNANGELVAIMQPAAKGDTCSYAIASTVFDNLQATSVTYGRGFYSGMRIRTILPNDKDAALSCMYMQSMIGDSASYSNVVDEFIKAHPNSYEGYMSAAELMAVYRGDINKAEPLWEKALSLAPNKAEIYFNKAKALYRVVLGGDTVSHQMLNLEYLLSVLDKAIEADNQPMYVNYKADCLYRAGQFSEAYDCYMSLVGSETEQGTVYVNASQCQREMKDYNAAIALMDSAVIHVMDKGIEEALPLVFNRGLLKDSVGRYREAIFDYNFYEQNVSYRLGANFYYIRSKAEVNCKMYQQAFNDIEMAISLAPDYTLFYFEKGLLCYRLNMLDEAISALERAKNLAGDVSDIYYLLGCSHSKAGNKAQAEENLQKALSMGHPDAANKLNELKK